MTSEPFIEIDSTLSALLRARFQQVQAHRHSWDLIQARAHIVATDTELLQPELERRAIHSEARRRPAWSGENPSGILEDCQNVRALGCFQSLVLAIISARCGAVIKVSDRNLQHGSVRNNNRALD
jgi:hypothetical protein